MFKDKKGNWQKLFAVLIIELATKSIKSFGLLQNRPCLLPMEEEKMAGKRERERERKNG